MNAVILAGGKHPRLMPLTADTQAAMIKLFDKPVMEHIISFLRKNSIVNIAVTLDFNDKSIRKYFGDGRDFGVNIEYVTEHEPLGSAGGVINCLPLVREDFLVVSGDVLCGFELNRMIEFHKSKNADVTMLLTRSDTPVEYGIVMTDENSRVLKICEKPSWGQVFSDIINAGVYLIKPDALKKFPAGKPRDFAADIFPGLIKNRAAVYGFYTNACWHDIGDIKRLFRCIKDALTGKLAIEIPAPRSDKHVYCASTLPADTVVIPPVYIGRGVRVGPGARLGPNAIIGADSEIGSGAEMKDCFVFGARTGKECSVEGAVVGAGCVLGDRVSLRSGSVLGERVRCGDGSFIDNNKRIWNGIEIPGGDIVKSNLITYAGKPDAFIEAGAISGMANIDITPELCAGVGLAAAGCGMRVGVGSTGDAVCDMLKSALVSGLCSAGAQVTEIDVRFAAAAVYVAKSYMFNLTVFIESNKDTVNIRFFDRLGMPLSGEARRGIETRMLSGEARRCDINGIIKPKLVTGAGEAYAASLLRHGALRGFSAAVSGDSAASDTLRSVLVMSGCRIVPERSGVITLTVYEDGTALIVSDENGFVPERCQMPALIALAYFMSGERQLAVSGEAPNALEHIAAEFGGKILRLGRDGAAAEEKYAREAIMCDGIAAAVFLCEFLHKNKTRLGELRAKLPEFFTKSCEVMINHDRGRVMRAVSESCRYMHREADNGLKICADGGWVHLSPSETRQAIRITGEGMSQEIAEELCIEFCDKTRGIDNAI